MTRSSAVEDVIAMGIFICIISAGDSSHDKGIIKDAMNVPERIVCGAVAGKIIKWVYYNSVIAKIARAGRSEVIRNPNRVRGDIGKGIRSMQGIADAESCGTGASGLIACIVHEIQ